MSDITNPQAWVERAEEDYEVARASVRRKRPLAYSTCFHAQQCAEKYLRAVLVAREAEFSRVHDLVLLQNQCENAGAVIRVDPKQLNTLTDYAVRVRYPGDDPTPEEARALDLPIQLHIPHATQRRQVFRSFLRLEGCV